MNRNDEILKSPTVSRDPDLRSGQVHNDKSKKTTDRDYYLFALRIIGDFGATIAVPIVIFVIIGQYLDEKYDQLPLFTILAFILAASISGKIIHRKAKEYGDQYQRLVDNEKKQDKR